MFAEKFDYSELLDDVILNKPEYREEIIDALESEEDFEYIKKYLHPDSSGAQFDMDRINDLYDILYDKRYELAYDVGSGPENKGDPSTFKGGTWSSTLYELWGIYWWKEPEGNESGCFKSKEEAYKDIGFLGWDNPD